MKMIGLQKFQANRNFYFEFNFEMIGCFAMNIL